MKTFGDYTYGFTKGPGIDDFGYRRELSMIGWLADRKVHTQEDTRFALVTTLDSGCGKDCLKAHPKLAEVAKIVGDGFLVPTELLFPDEEKFLTGFDEVWFFPHDQVTPKPNLSIVRPIDLDDDKMEALHEWLVENDCSAGFGDGIGTNFIVKDGSDAAKLWLVFHLGDE